MDAPEKKRVQAQTVIALEHRGSYDDIGAVFHQVREWARTHDVEVAGRGLTVFLDPPSEFDPRSAVFEVCLPVASAPAGDPRVQVKELPACTVASARVQGPYSDIPAHYTEMIAWLSAEGWEIAGPPREVYIRRPDAQGRGDPKEFVTEIQFPIEE